MPSVRLGAKRKRFDASKGPCHGKPSPRVKPHHTAKVRGHADTGTMSAYVAKKPA